MNTVEYLLVGFGLGSVFGASLGLLWVIWSAGGRRFREGIAQEEIQARVLKMIDECIIDARNVPPGK